MKSYICIIILCIRLSTAMINTDIKEYLIGRTKNLMRDLDNIQDKYVKLNNQYIYGNNTVCDIVSIWEIIEQDYRYRLKTDPSIDNLSYIIDDDNKNFTGIFNISNHLMDVPISHCLNALPK